MENHVKNVALSIQVSGNIKVAGSNKQALVFNQPDDKVVYFDLEVGAQEGAATIRVMATSGSEKATYEFKLYVGNPNPVSYEIYDIVIEPGSSQIVDFETFGIQGSNNATLELSVMPPMNLDARLGELIGYPHGCLEQVTSRIFPQLYLGDLVNLDQTRIQKIQTNVNAGNSKITAFPVAQWWICLLAGGASSQFVGYILCRTISCLRLRKKVYQLPVGFKSKWIAYQKNTAKSWQAAISTENDFDQAYRLYTLALAGDADVASMNRLKSTVGISSNSKLRLAAAYVLIGQRDAALQLVKSANIDNLIPKSNHYFDSRERNNAMALETFCIAERQSQSTQNG